MFAILLLTGGSKWRRAFDWGSNAPHAPPPDAATGPKPCDLSDIIRGHFDLKKKKKKKP